MRKIAALVRAGMLTAASYRLNLAVTLAMLVAQLVPTYYIGHTLQPFMAGPIRGEGGEYFSFLVVGTVAYLFIAASVDALPRAVEIGVTAGTLETLCGTPTPLPCLVLGLSGYELLWTTLKAAVVLVGASVLGAHISWMRLPIASVVIALLVAAYYGVGLVAASLVLSFRRAGPLQLAAVVASGFLGGITYPTSMVPTWLHGITTFIPATYGLRAVRRLLIDGAPVSTTIHDVGVLSLFAAFGVMFGSLCFVTAARYARRAGTLSQY